ncbi:hypothetical protein TNCV_1572271 [Trichonephila clavipes]|uniref:Uncharacterized protein n=1 Tax=Trichonephila clavipes TaxID=2585209 RepID=A0A8X6SL27_TRICX|nr:hypothetical protein TNCV_1572271 [Trichonephila clavipes]
MEERFTFHFPETSSVVGRSLYLIREKKRLGHRPVSLTTQHRLSLIQTTRGLMRSRFGDINPHLPLFNTSASVICSPYHGL